MGFFDLFKKKKSSPDDAVTHKLEFTVGPELREVDSKSVAALDNALLSVGSGELLHMMDPRRINAFSSGGPSTWSVAFIPVGDDHYFVTYGNSDRIDPARAGVPFELALRVPADAAGLWAGMLLRQLVRYMLASGRELKTWDFMPFPTPLTRVCGGADNPSQFPMTGMDTVMLVPDPLLPTVETPRGTIEIRRVVGIFPDEREEMEAWSAQGLSQVLRTFSEELTTDIRRESLTQHPDFLKAMDEGSLEEGSQFGYVAVPGVLWEATETSCTITLPGGPEARRIHRMVEARLPFGRNLLIHDTDPEKRLAVALEPADAWNIVVDGDVLILELPIDAPHLEALANPPDGPIVWKLN